MTNKCPAKSIESILKIITKRWNLQIMTDMFMGKTHFNEFKEGKKVFLIQHYLEILKN